MDEIERAQNEQEVPKREDEVQRQQRLDDQGPSFSRRRNHRSESREETDRESNLQIGEKKGGKSHVPGQWKAKWMEV
jgi:hypothetical protein